MTILGRSQAAVGVAFGVLEAVTLPGPVLIGVLADLGVSESAARATLARMVRGGELESRHYGRIALYRLAGRHLQLFNHIRENPVGPQWTGSFHTVVYDIAESDRQMRDEVRRRAFELGYGSPRPGLLLALADRSDWVDSMRRPGVMLEVGTFHCDLPTARRLANQAWDLDGVAAQLEAACRQLELSLAQRKPVPTGPGAIRALRALWSQMSLLHQQVPLLPPEFLPQEWAVSRLYELTFAESDRYDEALGDYQQQVIDTWPHADQVTYAKTIPSWRESRGTPASKRWMATNATDAYAIGDDRG